MNPSVGKVPTILDVARVAGVSKSTVSRVINDDPLVSVEAREMVTVAINSLNYRPNVAARSMGRARSMWIALLYQNPGADYMRRIQLGAMAGARMSGHWLSAHACDQFGDALIDEVRGIIEELQPTGVILTTPLCEMAPVLTLLQELKVRTVRLCPVMPGCHGIAVGFDETAAMRELTTYVIGLGHRELTYVGGVPQDVPDPRRSGFEAALAEAGLKPLRARFAFCGFQMQRARTWGLKALAAARRPTAVLAANDDMAIGILHAAHELGLRVPQDLSVTGFDDSYVAQLAIPRLTTVRQPLTELAQQAAALVAEAAPLPAGAASPPLTHELVLGASAGPVPR